MLLNGSPLIDGLEPVLAATVSRIEINGGPGANLIDISGVNTSYYVHWKLNTWRPTATQQGVSTTTLRDIVILGEAGDDTITGSPFGDYIDGGAGKDSIDSSRGNDLIGWEFSDNSVNGGAGDDLGFLSLNGLVPTVPAITIATNVSAGTATFVIDGTVKTVSNLEFIDVDGSDLDPSASMMITIEVPTSGSWEYIVYNPDDPYLTGALPGDSGKLKEIVVVAGPSPGGNKAPVSLGFTFGKVEYQFVGGPGNDEFAITPGPNKITIDGGGGTDSLTVNHLGYAVTQSSGLVQVAGRAAVNHVNVESVETGRTVFGGAAEAELKALGITASASVAMVGSTDVLTVTLNNQSVSPLSNVSITLGDDESVARGSFERFKPHVSAPIRVRATGGLTATVDPNPQGTPIPDILAGEPAYNPRVTFTAATIPAGGTATATIEVPHSTAGHSEMAELSFKTGLCRHRVSIPS